MHPPVLNIELSDEVSFELILVEGGRFMMGSEDGDKYERPVYEVNVPTFYMGKYPVRQQVWELIMKNNPADFKGANRPVENVSWNDAKAFIQKLNQHPEMPYTARLPSEAEWEYAARGGIYSQGFLYSGSDDLEQVGWYKNNSDRATKEVGFLLPNEIGLYDMSGNVYEWCEDQWHSNYEGAPDDGSAWLGREKGADRVVRGGRWIRYAWYCRVSFRFHRPPDNRLNFVGFRLSVVLQ